MQGGVLLHTDGEWISRISVEISDPEFGVGKRPQIMTLDAASDSREQIVFLWHNAVRLLRARAMHGARAWSTYEARCGSASGWALRVGQDTEDCALLVSRELAAALMCNARPDHQLCV